MKMKLLYITILFFTPSIFLSAQDVPDLLQQEIQHEIDKKVVLFQECLKILGDKQQSNFVRELAVKSALEFFESNDVIIEVSNKYTKKVTPKKIANYLIELQKLPHTRVEFLFDPHQIEELLQMSSNIFQATVQVNQHFRAYDNNNREKYSDFTIKRIFVDVEKYYDDILNGNAWEMKFTKIEVLETY